MPGPRDFTRTRERRVAVAKRYLQGEHQAVIAKDLGVSQSLISQDLAAIRRTWRDSALRDFDTLKSEQLEKIDLCEAAAWQGYARSQLAGKRIVKEGDRVSVTTERRTGDKGWLSVILSCIEQRSKLCGLNEPTRYAVDFDSLSESQLLRLANGEPARDVLSMPAPSPMAEA